MKSSVCTAKYCVHCGDSHHERHRVSCGCAWGVGLEEELAWEDDRFEEICGFAVSVFLV